MNPPVRYYSPAETAKRLNVTTKTLRHYERKGLVKALRTANGWRTYGPVEMARLHQVFALKRLGLPLSRISKLLSSHFREFDAVLEMQEVILRRQLVETEQALKLLVKAKQKLAAGGQLSSDEILNLTRETVMSNQVSESEVTRIIQDTFEKHISPEEQQRLQANGYDPVAASSVWEGLHAERRR
jgi:DNA-binding transcriptional MerR regulator